MCGDPARPRPHPATVLPQLRTALASRIVVEQAKGYLREHFDLSVGDAFALLRRYARSHGSHLTDVARNLISDADARPAILAAMDDLTPSVHPNR